MDYDAADIYKPSVGKKAPYGVPNLMTKELSGKRGSVTIINQGE